MHFTANQKPVAVAMVDGKYELEPDVFATVSIYRFEGLLFNYEIQRSDWKWQGKSVHASGLKTSDFLLAV